VKEKSGDSMDFSIFGTVCANPFLGKFIGIKKREVLHHPPDFIAEEIIITSTINKVSCYLIHFLWGFT
jgi:hypothetical protein